MQHIRNIAIIAHVDHGKTTLVDQLLKQSGTFRANQHTDERMMDSMDLEREKGITIKAKNAAFKYKDYHINIVDTPGHADFGGEVERILKMIDGVLLVVDAFDGPQAQTKFVLRKALEVGAKPIVVINKIDRDNSRPHKVLDMIFELFMELHATDAQLDFPVVYCSAKNGYAMLEMEHKGPDMVPLFDTIIAKIPPPQVDLAAPFTMLISNLDYSEYLGRIVYGKIIGGRINKGDPVFRITKEGRRERAEVTAIFSHSGMLKIEIEHASAGNIVGISGFDDAYIGETICQSETQQPLPFTEIDPPTIQMQICVNDSPLAGKEGKFLTARNIRERLTRETYTNVSLHVEETDSASVFKVSARGEMQIAILVEQMRREGFELMVSRPEVIFKRDDDGNMLEPYETLFIEVPTENLGGVLENLASRKGEITNMVHHEKDVSVEAVIPTRGLIGFETDLVNQTKGLGIMSHLFKEYGQTKGEINTRLRGVLIAMENGITTNYALANIQERGRLFVGPQVDVYMGMVIGESARPDDLVVNPCKAKALTNMRSQGDGKAVSIEPPLEFSLERSLEYIAPDEYLEVTPTKLRIRKKILEANARKRSEQKVGSV
ncbi:MAG: translational GTPase TypA [Verrucomicrobiota bacterium]|nr:translational GTPase TypA [Verrucomicrobiota bacterium]